LKIILVELQFNKYVRLIVIVVFVDSPGEASLKELLFQVVKAVLEVQVNMHAKGLCPIIHHL
jgi:hypothetical protein